MDCEYVVPAAPREQTPTILLLDGWSFLFPYIPTISPQIRFMPYILKIKNIVSLNVTKYAAS
jgi:hypothetical protein